MAASSVHNRGPNAPFGRVTTAMVTPFAADGTLDLAAAQRLATHLVDAGNDGLVISGTTGESPTTTDAEKDALLRAVIEAVGDRAKVVAGSGTNDTRHAIELSQQAEKAGADGLLVVTPYYNKPPQDSLLAHFRAVADSTALPVMVYDIPARTGTPIATETLLRLAEHDRVVAVKDAKYDIAGTVEVLAGSDLAYYCGADELNLAWLSIGAVGIASVVGHVASKEYAEMIRLVDTGDLPAARAIERRLVPAVKGIMTRAQGAIMVKAALELTGVLPSRMTRLPLLPASDQLVTALRGDLSDSGLMR